MYGYDVAQWRYCISLVRDLYWLNESIKILVLRYGLQVPKSGQIKGQFPRCSLLPREIALITSQRNYRNLTFSCESSVNIRATILPL